MRLAKLLVKCLSPKEQTPLLYLPSSLHLPSSPNRGKALLGSGPEVQTLLSLNYSVF